MTLADEIRKFICEKYIYPAKRRGEVQIQIVSGDLHSAMNLNSSMPSICQVLRGKKLKELCNVTLLKEIRKSTVELNSSTNIFIFDLSQSGNQSNTLYIQNEQSSPQQELKIPSEILIPNKKVAHQSDRTKANYISELVKIKLKENDFIGAYKFATDLQHSTYGEVNELVKNLISQIEARLTIHSDEVPIELIELADIINHKISFGFNT